MINVWGHPYLKTHKKISIENMPHFCYVVFEYLMVKKVKNKLGYFFHKIKIFPQKGAYQLMNMNPYFGFRKAVNFKS
jgi:hypothetical protein